MNPLVQSSRTILIVSVTDDPLNVKKKVLVCRYQNFSKRKKRSAVHRKLYNYKKVTFGLHSSTA